MSDWFPLVASETKTDQVYWCGEHNERVWRGEEYDQNADGEWVTTLFFNPCPSGYCAEEPCRFFEADVVLLGAELPESEVES